MSTKYSKLLWICVMLLVYWSPTSVAANAGHPLKPIDQSSPRATLKSFLAMGDAMLLVLRDEYWNDPNPETAARLFGLGVEVERMLDLSGIAPAAQLEMGRDGYVYLYEVLSRIELPPEAEIPDAAAYADAEEDEQAKGKAPQYKKTQDQLVSWTVPHTEITLVRIEDGPRAGQFLFSSSTVAGAEVFYEKTRALPYLRDVPLKNYAEIRQYLSMGGWMLSPRIVEGFPDWLKLSVSKQAVWKWIALLMLIVITTAAVVFIHRLARRRLVGNASKVHLHHLATPVSILVLTQLMVYLVNRQLIMTGWISGGVTLVATAITYLTFIWMAWTGSMAVAEAIIASPRIPDQSLNAHLLRLAARTFGIVIVISIIFYVSNQFGAPLYGLVAGVGVGGIAIALAAQGTIENFIGGLNLFADQPIRVGDFCRYGEDPNAEWQRIGSVESIGLRSTRIRGIDGTVTTIPNAEFSRLQIVNFSMRKSMLLKSVLGLRYETTDDQLRFVLVKLRDMLLGHPQVIEENPRVRFTGFGDFSLNVEIRVDIDTSDRDEFRAIREDILLRVMKIVKDAGTGFAFPSSTVYHTRDQGLDTERQQDAEAQVRDWCSAQELPFPNFTIDYRSKTRNTLDYPPEGSPEASQ